MVSALVRHQAARSVNSALITGAGHSAAARSKYVAASAVRRGPEDSAWRESTRLMALPISRVRALWERGYAIIRDADSTSRRSLEADGYNVVLDVDGCPTLTPLGISSASMTVRTRRVP